MGDAGKKLSEEKPTVYSQSHFGLTGVKMEKSIFDRRFIDVESNGDVEVKISSSRDMLKEDDILHVINVELPADLPQNLNGNGSDLYIVAISYKTDKLFVRSKEISSKCKGFVFVVQF